MSSKVYRLPLVDALKAIGCLMIVWHHLAFYGPMSDAAYPLAPGLIDWLYANARMAVQAFLVIGGFLAAMSLSADERIAGSGTSAVSTIGAFGTQALRRYQRLAIPCIAALTLAILCAAAAARLIAHPSIPAPPTPGQLLAHLLLLQDLLGIEALSAGVWYVAIDFQLYLMTLTMLAAARHLPGMRPTRTLTALTVGVAAASLLYFNRDDRFDAGALYFAGAWCLGMIAWRSTRSTRPLAWIALMLTLGGIALWIDWRTRIAVALACALLLALGQQRGVANRWSLPAPLAWLGQASYSVFLVHFPVCLLVNALVSRAFPGDPVAGAFGMLAAFIAAMAAAALLYRMVESRALPARLDLRWHAVFLGVGMIAILLDEASA